jgi:hypothetical protein
VKHLIAPSSCFALVASLLLVHCGGSTSSPGGDGGPTHNGNPMDSGSSVTNDGGGNPDGSLGSPDTGHPNGDSGHMGLPEASVTDSGQPSETGGGCVTPPHGAPCDPGVVTCNMAPCAVPANFCCGVQGGAEMCDPAGTMCTGASISCDESGDCMSGSICCMVATSISSADISCQMGTSCMGGLFSIQVCKTSAECANGMPCVPQTCMFGGATLTLEACGNVPTCTPL